MSSERIEVVAPTYCPRSDEVEPVGSIEAEGDKPQTSYFGTLKPANNYRAPTLLEEPNWKEGWNSILFWYFGFALLGISFVYFYWAETQCSIHEHDEANMTVAYAINELSANNELSESATPHAMSV